MKNLNPHQALIPKWCFQCFSLRANVIQCQVLFGSTHAYCDGGKNCFVYIDSDAKASKQPFLVKWAGAEPMLEFPEPRYICFNFVSYDPWRAAKWLFIGVSSKKNIPNSKKITLFLYLLSFFRLRRFSEPQVIFLPFWFQVYSIPASFWIVM